MKSLGRSLKIASLIIEKWEGCHKWTSPGLYGPYKDPINIWTIGIGTIGSWVHKDTPPITREKCLELVQLYLITSVNSLRKLTDVNELSDEQLAAVLSFCYNLGVGAFQTSTLRKKINRKDYNGAAAEFRKWNKAGGKVLRGLTLRRLDEEKLFSGNYN